jgi:predicted glutamine amidotransferase
MCGLVGILRTDGLPLDNNQNKMFQTLLKLDVLRGEHSTGVFAVNSKGNGAVIHKHVGAASYASTFSDNAIFDAKGSLRNGAKALFGHNRYATVGKADTDNAHPFLAGKIVGMHNGTIHNWILSRLEKHNPYGTDSEFIYNQINSKGLKATIDKLDGGAWALTYYDMESETYNFLRNKERPLFIAWNDVGVMAWASEKWMLEVAASRNFCDFTDVESLSVDTHLSISKDGKVTKEGVAASSFTYFPYKPTNPKVTGKVWKPDEEKDSKSILGKCVELSPVKLCTELGQTYISCHVEGYLEESLTHKMVPYIEARVYLKKEDDYLKEWLLKPYNEDGELMFCSVKIKAIKRTPVGKLYAVADRRTLEGPYFYESEASQTVKGYGGVELYKEEFDKKVKSGCAHCLSVPQFENGSNVIWVDQSTFLCDDCSENNVAGQYGISNVIYM